MSLTFDECLQKFYDKLQQNYESIFRSYSEDAEELQKFLLQCMKANNDEFRAMCKGAELAKDVHTDINWKLPDFFEVKVRIELPVPLEPQLCPSCPGYVLIKANKRHFLENDSYLSRCKLRTWFKTILSHIIGTGIWYRSTTGRIFKISYDLNSVGNGVIATDERNRKREICLDFLPVFYFPAQKWILPTILANNDWAVTPKNVKAVTDANAYRSFAICTPHWTHLPHSVTNNVNLKHAFCLIKALRATNELWEINGFLLKSLLMDEMQLLAAKFSQECVSKILIHLLKSLLVSLEKRHLPFYLDNNVNHMIIVSDCEAQKYIKKLKSILEYFSELKDQGKAQFGYFKTVFGINP